MCTKSITNGQEGEPEGSGRDLWESSQLLASDSEAQFNFADKNYKQDNYTRTPTQYTKAP